MTNRNDGWWTQLFTDDGEWVNALWSPTKSQADERLKYMTALGFTARIVEGLEPYDVNWNNPDKE